jgi:hypothetical protein
VRIFFNDLKRVDYNSSQYCAYLETFTRVFLIIPEVNNFFHLMSHV